MIDHFGLQCADLDASGAFYDTVLATLGYTLAALGTTSNGQAPQVTRRTSPLTGNFVSFSIEA